MTDQRPKPETIEKLFKAVYPSFALLAGIQLDLFTPLKDGPLGAEQIADAIHVRPDKLGPLLYALAAAGLLRVEDGLFSNTDESDHFLVRGRPSYVGDIHELISDIWNATLQTSASIRTGEPQAKHDFSAMPKEELESFFRGLHYEAVSTGHKLAKRDDFSSRRRLLDVGGGSGGLAISATGACPDLRATVVDLPSVTPITERFVQEAGAADRVTVTAADIAHDSLTGVFDVAVMKAFIQTLSPQQADRAIKNVSAVLEPGGIIFILGNGILDNSRVSPPETALFNIAFLNLYDGGRAYTEQEHKDWLTEAGFEGFERTTFSDGFGLLTARKSE